MDTDSLYLALAEENLENCILPDKIAQWLQFCRNDCRDDFIADVKKKTFPRPCCAVHKSQDKRKPVYSKRIFAVLNVVCAARRIVAMLLRAKISNLIA